MLVLVLSNTMKVGEFHAECFSKAINRMLGAAIVESILDWSFMLNIQNLIYDYVIMDFLLSDPRT